MHIIIVTHDNSLPVLGATSDIPAERYSSPYLFLSVCKPSLKLWGQDGLIPTVLALYPHPFIISIVADGYQVYGGLSDTLRTATSPPPLQGTIYERTYFPTPTNH